MVCSTRRTAEFLSRSCTARRLCTRLADNRLARAGHQYCGELGPDMQIIVADHVELLDDWFRESIAERWRDGIALVPTSWLRD
jgi:hypothetical protein